MVYIGCVLVVCLSAYIGKCFAKVYVLRDKFYKEFFKFINYLEGEIVFFQKKSKDLIDNYIQIKGDSFSKELYEIKHILIGEKNSLDFKMFFYLKKEERMFIEEFLLGFGCKDLSVEVDNIKKIQVELGRKKDEAERLRKCNEGLIYKVCLAMGVVFCILIV